MVLFLIVTSCEQEEIFESQQVEQTTEKKFKIKQYTFKEIESKPIIQETFQIFDKTADVNIKGKSVMEKMYKFTIDSSRINEIQAENYTSYTIRIKRDYETKGYFENLVIEKDSLNNINAYIIKYTPNADIQINTEHNSFYFEGERSIKKIIYNASKVAYKMTTICYWVTETWCSWDYDHVATGSCFQGTHLYEVTSRECITYNDGSSGGGSNDSSEGNTSTGDDNAKPGGTSSTSGNDESNPIVTAPILFEDCDGGLKDADGNCLELPLTIFNIDSLTEEQKALFEIAINELVKNCLGAALLDAVDQVNIMMGATLGSGEYNPATNTISFRSNSDIGTTTLGAELMHAYQQQLYGTLPGIYNGTTNGGSNIEFEEKAFNIMFDMMANEIAGDVGISVSLIGYNMETEILYNWLIDLQMNHTAGIITLSPEELESWFEALEEFQQFHEGNPEHYGDPIDYNQNPDAILNLTNKVLESDCN